MLGTNELAPLTMSAAIATIASGGTYCEPIVLDKVVGPDGKELPGQNANCRAALSADVAAAAAYALSGPTGGYPGWTTGSAANPRDGHALIGKTGTTDNRENSWMLASTSKVSMVVWVGNIKGHQDLGRVNVTGGNANSVKFRIFKNTMASINTEYGGEAKFPDAPDVLINGITQPVPDVTGQTIEQATSLLESLGLRAKVGDPQPSAVEAGKVARHRPGRRGPCVEGLQRHAAPERRHVGGDHAGCDQEIAGRSHGHAPSDGIHQHALGDLEEGRQADARRDLPGVDERPAVECSDVQGRGDYADGEQHRGWHRTARLRSMKGSPPMSGLTTSHSAGRRIRPGEFACRGWRVGSRSRGVGRPGRTQPVHAAA